MQVLRAQTQGRSIRPISSRRYAVACHVRQHQQDGLKGASAGFPPKCDKGVQTPSAAAPSWSRRAALLGLPFCANLVTEAVLVGPTSGSALATGVQRLRSVSWAVPSELTVLNNLDRQMKIYWINYDGDPEYFGVLSPGNVFTVQTFESHAWRFVDATSGSVLGEHVAAAGQQLVRVAGLDAAAAGGHVSATLQVQQVPGRGVAGDLGQGRGRAPGAVSELAAPSAPEPPRVIPGVEEEVRDVAAMAFEGFDGLGAAEATYSLAQLREINIYPGGGNVVLGLPGAEYPLEVSLAGPEALSLVSATGSLEQRRPSTLGTWTRSLLASGVTVQRICITRMVDGIFYSRIVLSRPDATLASLDATPGDSLSLAIQLHRPIYVANDVVKVHQQVLDVFARRRQAMEAAAAQGLLDEAAEAEADRQAQDTLDSITAGIPSAPRPVRPLVLDRELSA